MIFNDFLCSDGRRLGWGDMTRYKVKRNCRGVYLLFKHFSLFDGACESYMAFLESFYRKSTRYV